MNSTFHIRLILFVLISLNLSHYVYASKDYSGWDVVKTSIFKIVNIPISNEYAICDVVISQSEPGGTLQISGRYDGHLFVNMAQHTIKGPVTFQGDKFERYSFEGGELKPFKFLCIDGAYWYREGQGRVFDHLTKCIYVLEDGHPLISLGYTYETVIESQKKLSNQGIDPGAIDGQWGKKTWEAVEEFQERLGLPITGQLDGPTKRALDSDKPFTTSDKYKGWNQIIASFLYLTDLPISDEYREVDIAISQSEPGGDLIISWRGLGFITSTTRKKIESEIYIFNNGAWHSIKGPVTFRGDNFERYTFEGDESKPLKFLCSRDSYIYIEGNGRLYDYKTKCIYILEKGHSIIEPGYKKELILTAQKKLLELGFYAGAIDGIWDSEMLDALKQFQEKHAMPVTRQLDQPTRKALGL